MSLEVGWYLRLSKAWKIEALVRPGSVASLAEQKAINPGWQLETEGQGDHVLVVFTHVKRSQAHNE